MSYKRLTKKAGWHKDIDLTQELGYSYIYQRLSELENKIENGTLIELPCKVGDTVWFIVKRRHKFGFEPYIFIKKTKFTFYNLKKVLDGFNYTVFITKAEAEKKLKELKRKE